MNTSYHSYKNFRVLEADVHNQFFKKRYGPRPTLIPMNECEVGGCLFMKFAKAKLVIVISLFIKFFIYIYKKNN